MPYSTTQCVIAAPFGLTEPCTVATCWPTKVAPGSVSAEGRSWANVAVTVWVAPPTSTSQRAGSRAAGSRPAGEGRVARGNGRERHRLPVGEVADADGSAVDAVRPADHRAGPAAGLLDADGVLRGEVGGDRRRPFDHQHAGPRFVAAVAGPAGEGGVPGRASRSVRSASPRRRGPSRRRRRRSPGSRRVRWRR